MIVELIYGYAVLQAIGLLLLFKGNRSARKTAVIIMFPSIFIAALISGFFALFFSEDMCLKEVCMCFIDAVKTLVDEGFYGC